MCVMSSAMCKPGFGRSIAIGLGIRFQVELLSLSGSLGPNGCDPEIEKMS